MNYLISRQAAIDVLHEYFDGMLETDTWSPCDVYGLIEALPSAEPEIIRCRDCEYGEQDHDGDWFCRSYGFQMGRHDGSGFCSEAERRTRE